MYKLRKLLCIVGMIVGTSFINFFCYSKKHKKKLTNIITEKDKFYNMFCFMDNWLNAKIENKGVKDYLINKGYKNIAIYGMSFIGQTLINELKDSEINIKYGIDQDSEVYWDVFPIINADEVADDIDIIIVTALSSYDEIKKVLQNKVKCPIVSLEEIIDTL